MMLAMLCGLGIASGQDGTTAGIAKPPAPERPPSTLSKFDLDFKGGRPRELVAAIEKAIGKSLNALIPEQYADTQLPALKMKNVDAPQLFGALERASQKMEMHGSAGSYSTGTSSFGFRPSGSNLNDDTIWSFYVQKPSFPPPQRICRFYSLAAYLDRGVTVDDVTTAIKTGAKMLGEADEPQMSFHKDTKLLIAVGEPAKLDIIDAVLRALESSPSTSAGATNSRSKSAGQPAARGGEGK